MDQIIQTLKELAAFKRDFEDTRQEFLAALDKVAQENGRYLKGLDVEAHYEAMRLLLLDNLHKQITHRGLK